MVTKIFLCLEQQNLLKDLVIISNMNKSCQVVGTSTTLLEDLDILIASGADVLVVSPDFNVEKSYQMIDAIRENDACNRLKIVGIFKDLNAELIHHYLTSKINNFIIEPFICQDIFHAVLLENKDKKITNMDPQMNEELVAEHLIAKGVPIHLYGFDYLKTGTYLLYKNYGLYKSNITKIYGDVARKHFTTQSRVEKCMRTAIHHAVGYDEKATNSKVMLDIVSKLKCEEMRR